MAPAIMDINKTLTRILKMLLLVPSNTPATMEAEFTIRLLSLRVVLNTPDAAIPISRVSENKMLKKIYVAGRFNWLRSSKKNISRSMGGSVLKDGRKINVFQGGVGSFEAFFGLIIAYYVHDRFPF